MRGRSAPVTVLAALPAFAETTEQVAAALPGCRLLLFKEISPIRPYAKLVDVKRAIMAHEEKMRQTKRAILAHEAKRRQTERAIMAHTGQSTPESGILLPNSVSPFPKKCTNNRAVQTFSRDTRPNMAC